MDNIESQSIGDEEEQQADLYETGGGVLRLRVISPDGQILLLEGISAGESVQAIRSALAEQPLTAHLTSFDLILEPKVAKSAATAHGEDAAADASIPETSTASANAAEAAEKLQLQQQLVSVAEDGTVELNDVLELSEYACVGLESGSTVRMSRSPYDARSARFHLRRFHDLLKHPPAATASSDPKDPTRAARMQTIQQAQATGFEAEAAAVAVSDAVKEQQTQHYARSQKLLLVEAGAASVGEGLEARRKAGEAAAEEEAGLTAAWTTRLVGLHEQAQNASKRLECHRRESDRIVCARMPLLEPCSILSAGGVGSSQLEPSQTSSLTLGGFELGLSAPNHGHGLGLFFPKVLNAAGLDYCGPSRHLPPDQAALPALAVIDAEAAKAESLASSSPVQSPPLLSKEQPLLFSKVQQQASSTAQLQLQQQPEDDSWIDVDSKAAAAAVGAAASSSSKADRKKQQQQKRGGKGPAGNNGGGSSSSVPTSTASAPRDEKKHNSASSSATSSSGTVSGVGESNDDSDDGGTNGDSGDSEEDVENGAGGGGGGRDCVRYVCTSAFGPPTPQRRLAGDLVYLEVGLLDQEGLPFEADEAKERSGQDLTVVHVTGTARGWFVNGSTTARGGGTGGWFDPRPRRVLLPPSASSPASSSSSSPRSLLTPQFAAAPELHGLLVLVSPVFRRRWRKALKAAAVIAAAHEDPLATIAHMVVDGRLDSVVVRPSWCLPNLTGASNPFTSKTTTATPLSSLLAIGPAAAAAAEGEDKEGCELESGQAGGGGFDGEGLITADRFRCEEDLSSSSAQDDYRGALRDWNEEFQCYHELPCSNLNEKLTRAKMIYKVWSEFQEAAVVGAAAIASGQVPPINPTEPARSHVFVFNNTFFSYGVDSKDAYKVLGGDEAAAKSARHDMRNVQLLEQFALTTPPQTEAASIAVAEQDEKVAAAATATAGAPASTARLCTLATALVDLPCVGRRVVCQSIIPGILSGDQLSKLVYGAIEHGVPLHTDAGMQTLLKSVAECFHLATREMPSVPIGLADGPSEGEGKKAAARAPAVVVDGAEGQSAAATVVLSGAVEMKGIVGTDERKYILDLLRLTPRDANFVPRSSGGTGKWEDQEPAQAAATAAAAAAKEEEAAGQAQRKLADDDHAALLRPELIQRWRRRQQEVVVQSSEEAVDKKGNGGGGEGDNKESDDDLNVNVFMPFESSVDPEESRLDEAKARQVACWLWDQVLPALTRQVRKGTVLPLDGGVLVEVLHSFGVNVRYLGRLAALALEEEQKDQLAALQSVRHQKQQQQQPATTPTPSPAEGSCGVDAAVGSSGSSGSSEEADGGGQEKGKSSGSSQNQNSSAAGVVFPLYWRRLLEVEMVSRASKHVLRRLFDGLGPHSRQAPATTLAAFLNGLFGSGHRPATPSPTSSEAAAASSPPASSTSSSSTVQEKKAEATCSSTSSSTKKKKKKNGSGGNTSPTGAAAAVAAAKASVDKNAAAALKTGTAAADDCGVLSAEYLEFLSSQVLADPPTLPLHQCSSGSVWALIADEVRARYHHELLLWPNPHLLRSESSSSGGDGSGGAVDKNTSTATATWFEEHWGGPSPLSESPESAPVHPERHYQWAECCATKPTLLRRVVARLGLRIKAKRYDWSGQEPFKVSDLIEAVPVPKGCAGASSPPGWSRALFQRQGPLAWLNSGDDGKSDAGGDDSSEAKSATASSTSQALKPLPFGTGAGCGSGGGLGCLVPCPLGEVDELLAVAQVQALARSWESVYELAQQAFALAQATCGPLHRSTALALELVARALFNLGDPEVAVAQQTKALAIHEQLGGFDTPDVAAAHAQLALYHHKLGSLEAVPRHVLAPADEDGGEASKAGGEAAAAAGGDEEGGVLQMRSCVNLDRRLDRAARHMAAAAFLFELLGGPLHPEAADAYSKLGQFYHEAAMTATHHGFAQSSTVDQTDTTADATGTDQAAKTAAATHKKGNNGSSSNNNNGSSSSRRGPRPNRKARAQRKSQSQSQQCPLQQGAVELAVSALRCYREGLRRQTFGALGLRCGAEQADDDEAAAAEGSVVMPSRPQPWLTSDPAFTVLKGSGPSGSVSGVPVLGDEVLQFVVAETAQLVRDANATAAAATASASSVTAVAPPLSGSGGTAAGALPPPSALSATTAVTAAALNQTALLARIMQAQALHAMALAYERPLGMFKEALKLEKTAYKVYRLLLGEKHHLTATSEQFMRRFTDESVRALNASKQKKLHEQRKQQHQKQLKQQGRH